MSAHRTTARRSRTTDRADNASAKRENKRVAAPARPARSDLPARLTCPYPDYVVCPACGELEVEVWCYAEGVRCHACGSGIPHARATCYRSEVCAAPDPKATS